MKNKIYLLGACISTLVACNTTGDPNSGGIFWSEQKAQKRLEKLQHIMESTTKAENSEHHALKQQKIDNMNAEKKIRLQEQRISRLISARKKMQLQLDTILEENNELKSQYSNIQNQLKEPISTPESTTQIDNFIDKLEAENTEYSTLIETLSTLD